MSGQRVGPAVAADHRSVHPNFPGVPWWGAILLAVTATAVGFAVDAGTGDRELTMVFSVCFAIGCILAVLAVRQAAIFTAVIQPPLLLFVAVPGAYFLFHGATYTGVKDLLINCGYPLIERFPLMFFTSATVLLIGMARWYFGASAPAATPKATDKTTGLFSAVTAKLSAMTGRPAEDTNETPARRHAVARPKRAPRTAADRGGRAAPSRSRHARPPETEFAEPPVGRPRRPRPPRQQEPPAEPRRRSRGQPARDPRRQPPVDRRYATDRPERGRRFEDYEPLEPQGTNGTSSHHPISRVRYRRTEDGDDHAPQRRVRPRHARYRDAGTWE